MDAFGYNVAEFNSRRSPVFSCRGMIAAAHPLAATAGLRILFNGGNAIDAAVASAAVLGVVAPYQTGLGGDAFALIHKAGEDRVRALNASGPAPAAATLEGFRAAGLTCVPKQSPLSWTVPGCVDGWSQMLERYGTMSFKKVLQPAIDYACVGFPVAPCDAYSWKQSEEVLLCDAHSSRTLLVEGHAPRPGDVFVQRDLARTLGLLAEQGRDCFYEGEIAERLASYSQAAGGLLTMQDLSAYRAEWSDPIETSYRGYRVLECPPNGQGLAALLALRSISGIDIARYPRHSPECWHLLIETMKQAMVDAERYIADPRFSNIPVAELLSAASAPRGWSASDPAAKASGKCETVYLAVTDSEGNAVSFINSVYENFGSGHVAEGLGFVVQNRGSGFSLDATHPNRLEPGKRPFHTIIPGMLLRENAFEAAFGVTGGHMQPQGHLQLLVNLIDYGSDVQSAIDAPRFWWEGGRRVVIEAGVPEQTCSKLSQWGHDIVRRDHRGMGGAQIIRALPGGVWAAGSEPRQDGCAVGY